jgi:drug/metabolite transporter (DMT)-like permease
MPESKVIGALLGLSLLSTAFAYLIYFELIARVGPTKTLSVTFLSPCFGILWGALFLGEPIYVSMWLGLTIILTGVFLITEVKVGT